MTALPDVATAAEAGINNYEASGWLALLAPHGTPKPIIAKLNAELVAAHQGSAGRSQNRRAGRGRHLDDARGARQVHRLGIRQMARQHGQGRQPADSITAGASVKSRAGLTAR